MHMVNFLDRKINVKPLPVHMCRGGSNIHFLCRLGIAGSGFLRGAEGCGLSHWLATASCRRGYRLVAARENKAVGPLGALGELGDWREILLGYQCQFDSIYYSNIL